MSALLEVDDLSVGFRTRRGVVQALSAASVTIEAGELLLIVGESGSGKTVLAHSLLRLLPRNVDVSGAALVGEPDLVIADEPTSGLDSDLVDTTAAQLRDIAARGSALLVITHDLRLAERLGGRIALLYASRIVELGPTAAFFAAPSHPYGRELLRALPEREGKSIPGLSPELTALPGHCAFAPRCPDCFERCTEAIPDLYPAREGALSRCFVHAER